MHRLIDFCSKSSNIFILGPHAEIRAASGEVLLIYWYRWYRTAATFDIHHRCLNESRSRSKQTAQRETGEPKEQSAKQTKSDEGRGSLQKHNEGEISSCQKQPGTVLH